MGGNVQQTSQLYILAQGMAKLGVSIPRNFPLYSQDDVQRLADATDCSKAIFYAQSVTNNTDEAHKHVRQQALRRAIYIDLGITGLVTTIALLAQSFQLLALFAGLLIIQIVYNGAAYWRLDYNLKLICNPSHGTEKEREQLKSIPDFVREEIAKRRSQILKDYLESITISAGIRYPLYLGFSAGLLAILASFGIGEGFVQTVMMDLFGSIAEIVYGDDRTPAEQFSIDLLWQILFAGLAWAMGKYYPRRVPDLGESVTID